MPLDPNHWRIEPAVLRPGPCQIACAVLAARGRSELPFRYCMNTTSPSSQNRPDPRTLWGLDPDITFLNHGSFGACPRAVLERQREVVTLLERDPVRFFLRDRQALIDRSRSVLAATLGAATDDLVFVPNVTHACNAVLRWLTFDPGDEILITGHGYNAVNNAVRFVAAQSNAHVRVAKIRLPIMSEEEVVEQVMQAVTPRTRLAVIDHITSVSAVVLPIATIIGELRRRGITTMVDGAHAPGAVDLSIEALGADYYIGNAHKWLCAPKGAGFLHARPAARKRDREPCELQPPAVSHGYNTEGPMCNRFHDAFDFPGTIDPSPWCCVGTAIEFLIDLTGDLSQMMESNGKMASEGADLLEQQCGLRRIAPPSMNGPMVALKLPDDPFHDNRDGTTSPDPSLRLHMWLRDEYGVQVPVYYFPGAPQRLLRISAHVYNSLHDYQRIADAINELLPNELARAT